MKKLIYTLLASSFALFSTTAIGQTITDDGSVTVSANVVNDISVTGVTNVSFGAISDDITVNEPSINSVDGTSTNQEGDVTVGRFEINATQGQTIQFTGDANINLTRVGETETVRFVPSFSGAEGIDTDPAGGTAFNLNDTHELTGNNDYTVWMGGTLDTPSETPLPVGEYSGTYTLTVDYVF